MSSRKATPVRICSNNNLAKCKRSQVTIFIIIAMLIVFAIILFFILRGSLNIPGVTTKTPDINAEMQSCTKNAVLQAINIILPRGGYLNPENYKLYENDKVAYLCYQSLYYKPCVNQQPAYLEHLKGEIKSYISEKIEDCFYKIQQDYRDKGYSFDMTASEISVNLNPKQVNVNINKEIKISKNSENRIIKEFEIKIDSPIYDLAVVANEIINQEAKFCYFEYLGYMLLYPSYKISKTDINGETKIYKIEDKYTHDILKIAVRSCAMPAGM